MRRKHGGRRARVRGLAKVKADFSLLAAAANIARLGVLKISKITPPHRRWSRHEGREGSVRAPAAPFTAPPAAGSPLRARKWPSAAKSGRTAAARNSLTAPKNLPSTAAAPHKQPFDTTHLAVALMEPLSRREGRTFSIWSIPGILEAFRAPVPSCQFVTHAPFSTKENLGFDERTEYRHWEYRLRPGSAPWTRTRICSIQRCKPRAATESPPTTARAERGTADLNWMDARAPAGR